MVAAETAAPPAASEPQTKFLRLSSTCADSWVHFGRFFCGMVVVAAGIVVLGHESLSGYGFRALRIPEHPDDCRSRVGNR